MAFMGRGDFPSIEHDHIDNTQDNNYYRDYRYYNRIYYYVPFDNTYVIMQMIVTFIILIVGVITFFATYQSTIMDPIESTKKLFIHTYLIIIGISLAITLATNFLSKSKTILIKRLAILSAISIIIMLVFLGIKLHLDTTYTKDKFEQFYTEQSNESSNTTAKSKIDIGITGMRIKTEKEYYMDECSKLYGIFSTKVYGTMRTSSFANYFTYLPNSKNIKN